MELIQFRPPAPSLPVHNRSRTGSFASSPRCLLNCYMLLDPYATLGISTSASMQQIKQAYRRLALLYHPDVCNGDQCGSKFQSIRGAYETIVKSKRHLVAAKQKQEEALAGASRGSGAQSGEESSVDLVDYYLGNSIFRDQQQQQQRPPPATSSKRAWEDW